MTSQGGCEAEKVTAVRVSVQPGGSPRESSSLSLNQGDLVLTCTSDLFVARGVLSTLLRREDDMSKG